MYSLANPAPTQPTHDTIHKHDHTLQNTHTPPQRLRSFSYRTQSPRLLLSHRPLPRASIVTMDLHFATATNIHACIKNKACSNKYLSMWYLIIHACIRHRACSNKYLYDVVSNHTRLHQTQSMLQQIPVTP